MIKLIVSDMDGTLLNERIEVSDANAQAVKRAQNEGIDFVIATGRDYSGGYSIAQKKDIVCPFIGLNGAEYFDTSGSLKYSRGLDKKSVRNLMDLFSDYPVYFELMTNKGLYSDNKEQHLEHLRDILTDINPNLTESDIEKYKHLYLNQKKATFVSDYKHVVNDERMYISKISVQSLSGPSKLRPLRDLIEQEVSDIAVTASSRKNLEINHEKATKGYAVSQYAKINDIGPDEVMTLGDNINDLSMLEWAKYGTAMENAVPEAKEAARFTTSSNAHNGVAEAISRVLSGDIYKN